MKINFNEQTSELTITIELSKVAARWHPARWWMVARIAWALLKTRIGA